MAEYRRLLADTEPATPASLLADRCGYPQGSFGTLVNGYLGSGEFKQNKPSTKAEYRRVLEELSRAREKSASSHGVPVLQTAGK